MIIYSGSLAPVMREYERRKAITFKVKYLFFGVSFWFLFLCSKNMRIVLLHMLF